MPAPALTLRQLAERDERTFPSYPQIARYFPASSIEEARTRLGRAIERGNGPGLVIGGPGTGKSLLLQVLAAQYQEQFDIVLPACARLCTRRALLQSILFELGLPYRSRDEGELRLRLLEHLLSKEECPSGLLLLVDEAQTLSIALLDELRVLTNLVRGAVPRVRLVLAGSSSLEESFADPELESFSQRLAARCYLSPFTSQETSQFIRAQIAASHARPDDIFEAEALPAVFEATDGIPRLVNQLCDRAIMDASVGGRAQIDRQVIQAVWADLQQLPTPWDTPESATIEPHSQVIEFGNLVTDNGAHQPAAVLYEGDDEFDSTLSTQVIEFDTELDIDDEPEMPAETAPLDDSISAPTQQSAKPQETAADPFAEKFDEEEIVLDNFAAWDDMFRRDMPRVANRRDPEFATLVAAAIQAAPPRDLAGDSKAANLSFAFDLASVVGEMEDDTEPAETTLPTKKDRPPLRIADVSDVPATTLPEASTDDSPVLIVEDDAAPQPPRKGPVRREDYRQLFSRLRSG